MDRARLFFLTNEVTVDSSINKALGQELEKTIKKNHRRDARSCCCR